MSFGPCFQGRGLFKQIIMLFRIFTPCIHQVKEKTPPDLRGSETKTVFKRAVFFY